MDESWHTQLELGERQISNTADASDFDSKQAGDSCRHQHKSCLPKQLEYETWVSVEIKGDKSREKI